MAAARTFGLTPSAVSKAISTLEAKLGVRLLTRSTRSLVLTDDGERFYERCRHIVAELEEAQQEARSASESPRGRLRINLHANLARARILPAIPEFMRRYPDLRVEIMLTRGPRSPYEEDIDVIVFIGDPPDSNLVAHRIGSTRFTTCASADYLAVHGTPKEPDALSGHNCLIYVRPNNRPYDEWIFERSGERHAVHVAGNLHVNDGHALVDAGIAGSGIVRVLDFTAEVAIASQKLVPLLNDWYGEGPPLHVVYPRGRNSSAKIRVFAQFVSDLFGADGRSSTVGQSAKRWIVPRG